MNYHATITKDRLECGENKVQVLVEETATLSAAWDRKARARNSLKSPNRIAGFRRKKKSSHTVVIRARNKFSSRYRSHGNHLLRGAFIDAQLRKEVIDATESDEFFLQPQKEEDEEENFTRTRIVYFTFSRTR